MIFSNNRLGKFIRNGRFGTRETYTELETILPDHPGAKPFRGCIYPPKPEYGE